MPVTTPKQILDAIKARIAANPTSPIAKRLKDLRDDKNDPADAPENLADAAEFLGQTVPQLNAAGLEPLQKHLAKIARNWATMSPAAKLATRNRLRAILVHAAAQAWLKDRMQDFKRRIISDFEDTDPVEAVVAAALNTIANSAVEAEVQAAAKTLSDNEHLLPTPAP